MTVQKKNPPDCFTFLLAKAYQKAHGRFRRKLEPLGLTNIQHAVLEALWYEEGQTAAELGQMLILDKATLSGVLVRMSESDWIERHPDPNDGRGMRIYPSGRANRLKEEILAVRREADEEVLSRFRLEEQLLLKRFLTELMNE